MHRDQHNPDTTSPTKQSQIPKSQVKQSQVPPKYAKFQHSQTQSQGPSRPTKSPALREVVVGARTGVSMLVPLKLDDSDVEAVVDSGVQATVMSDELYKSLQESPKDC